MNTITMMQYKIVVNLKEFRSPFLFAIPYMPAANLRSKMAALLHPQGLL